MPAIPVERHAHATDFRQQRPRPTPALRKTIEVAYRADFCAGDQKFTPKFGKPIVDAIDAFLAQHYGFTVVELNFIVNYDIKYRFGAEDEESDE